MKLRLSILFLAAAALAAAPAAGQTIKSLGYNTTNGQIVYSGTNALTFTNALQFSTNARAATRTNLGGTTVGNAVFTATNAAAAATAIGLGTTNDVQFNKALSQSTVIGGDVDAFLHVVTQQQGEIQIGWGSGDSEYDELALTLEQSDWKFYKPFSVPNATNRAIIRTNLGLGATNAVTFSNITANGTLAVSNTATFSTNVTVNGSLSVGSFTTTTPSTWALDATQTAAATNGVLTLPSNANVIRLTNNNAISSVTNGVLGAFYYLVNQATNAVTISNVGGITIDGAQNLTLSPNESATLVATGPTNVSVANRGDLTDVALGGTANTAPSQTASSGSSLMTRDLSDVRYAPRTMDAFVVDDFWGGGDGAQFVGKLGWYAYDGAAWAYGGFTADIPGTWRLQNSSITNGRAGLESSQFGSRGRDWTWQWTFKLNKITQARWAFGNFPNDISARSAASGHFGVYYDSTNSSNWHVYVSDGSTNTVTDTGIAATTNYAAIKMSYIGTNLTVAIANSSLVFGAPVAIPTTALGVGLALNIPSVYINNLDGNAQSVDLDRMWMYGRFPNRD
jgi:hypothetical protein